MNSEFKTPRFVLAAFFSIAATIAFLLTGEMSADQYIMVMGVILGLYGADRIFRKPRE